MRFSKDMSIEDALMAHPKAVDILMKYGMGCSGCMVSSVESIENGAYMHNVDVEELISELNRLDLDDN
jgi:hybrid cluster-associated redox disulfide protein